MTGYGAITTIGAATASLAVHGLSTYSHTDSELYISDPIPVVACAVFVCFWIASAFMVVFDMVGDTILYCFMIDQDAKDEEERNRYAIEMQEREQQSWTGWLLSGGMGCVVGKEYTDGNGVHNTPKAVKELVVEHGRHRHS
mmetsp:Transcript_76567/g.199024  ORF Transcript_76567/g.199024 Transcript_76567/m.199024 type:complete len:141 (+) Transcript_76567:3-425(+)